MLLPDEPDEHELQIQCSDMLRIILLPDVQWTAIDHAHSLDRRVGRHGVPIGILEAKKRQRRGIKPGITDYLFWHRTDSFACELKVGDNDLDPDQRDFMRGLIAAGVRCKVCWTKDQVFNTVVGWGLTRPMQVTA
jgi:hypothetical protein